MKPLGEQDLLMLRCGAAAARYRLPFARAARGTVVQWDWSAALMPLWGLHWRIGLTWLLYLSFPFFGVELSRAVYRLGGPEPHAALGFAMLCGISAVLKGMFGTWLLHRHLLRDVRREMVRAGSASAAIDPLVARAPRWNVPGLLGHVAAMVVASGVMLFILAFSNTYPLTLNPPRMRMMTRGAMRSVHAAQHDFLAQHGRLAADLTELGLDFTSEAYEVEMSIRDSVTYELVGRARYVPVVCRTMGDARQPALDDVIPCARR